MDRQNRAKDSVTKFTNSSQLAGWTGRRLQTTQSSFSSLNNVVNSPLKPILKFVILLFISSTLFGLLAGFFEYSVITISKEQTGQLSRHYDRSTNRNNGTAYRFVSKPDEFPHRKTSLPTNLQPLTYQLRIRVNITTSKYRGQVQIKLLCSKPTPYVILHLKGPEVLEAVVTALSRESGESVLPVKQVIAYRPAHQLCIELGEVLSPGREYTVKLTFKAKISDRLEGFYKSSYTTAKGIRRTIAITHLEPAHAREIFPCFDEPSLKANFTITIIHDPSHHALSNMPVTSHVIRKDGLVEETFAPSVQMSTYLVAFTVLDFKYKEKTTSSGVKVRVHAPPDDYYWLDYAATVGAEILSFYESLFGVSYPLPKLDMVAVPDFLNGAMENWGLVTFRRAYLIYNKDFIPVEMKRKIVSVIAHELAHQWFGNLVTMKWWNDIWLNEGFANFMQSVGTSHVTKRWGMLGNTAIEMWQGALQADSIWNTHPISVSVGSPEEMDEMFDVISYNKGAMVLRMLTSVIGKDTFLQGLKHYIEAHKFGNADTDELWNAMEQASGKLDIKSIMNSWTSQKSFPIVTVNRSAEGFVARQESYIKHLTNYSCGEDSCGSKDRWFVPITYVTETNPSVPKLVWLNRSKVFIKDIPKDSWIKINLNATGFYIVNYDIENWKRIVKQLHENHTVFTPSDRAGLIHDAFRLACEGLVDPLVALNLSTYLVSEKHPVPWTMMRVSSGCIANLFNKTTKSLYKKFQWQLESHLLDFLGLDDTGNESVQLMRYAVLTDAVKYGQRKDLLKIFKNIFTEMKRGKLGSLEKLSPNFRYLAFYYGADKKSEEDWLYLWSVYLSTPFDADRKFLRIVITSFSTDKLRNRNLKHCLQERYIRPQDALYWLEMVHKGSGKHDARWTFIKDNWAVLSKRYSGNYKLSNLVKVIAGGFHTKQQLQEVKEFFKKKANGEIPLRTQQQTLEKIKRNIAGRPRHLLSQVSRMAAWLTIHVEEL